MLYETLKTENLFDLIKQLPVMRDESVPKAIMENPMTSVEILSNGLIQKQTIEKKVRGEMKNFQYNFFSPKCLDILNMCDSKSSGAASRVIAQCVVFKFLERYIENIFYHIIRFYTNDRISPDYKSYSTTHTPAFIASNYSDKIHNIDAYYKVHIYCLPKDNIRVLAAVCPLLVNNNIMFKVICCDRARYQANLDLAEPISGKFITIYTTVLLEEYLDRKDRTFDLRDVYFGRKPEKSTLPVAARPGGLVSISWKNLIDALDSTLLKTVGKNDTKFFEIYSKSDKKMGTSGYMGMRLGISGTARITKQPVYGVITTDNNPESKETKNRIESEIKSQIRSLMAGKIMSHPEYYTSNYLYKGEAQNGNYSNTIFVDESKAPVFEIRHDFVF